MKLDRILVALDSSGSTPLLKIAVELAKYSEAELRAIYIEDTQWFEASKFSFTQQVSSFTGELIEFNENQISKESRALNAILKRRFSNLSSAMNIRYSYHSVKGSIDQELMKAAGEVDLVLIGKTGHTFEQRKLLGSNARYLAEQCSVPVLFWNSKPNWPQQMIGIGTTPEENINTVKWTIYLGDKLNRDIRLFWQDQIVFNNEWLNKLEEFKGAWRDAESRLKYLSEEYDVISHEELKGFKDALFVIQRNALSLSVTKLLEQLPNSVLLID